MYSCRVIGSHEVPASDLSLEISFQYVIKISSSIASVWFIELICNIILKSNSLPIFMSSNLSQ